MAEHMTREDEIRLWLNLLKLKEILAIMKDRIQEDHGDSRYDPVNEAFKDICQLFENEVCPRCKDK